MSPLIVSTRPLHEPPGTSFAAMPRASSLDLDAAATLFVITGVARHLSDIIGRKADLQPRRRFSKPSHPSSFGTSAI